jgi:chromosome partitioning protein
MRKQRKPTGKPKPGMQPKPTGTQPNPTSTQPKPTSTQLTRLAEPHPVTLTGPASRLSVIVCASFKGGVGTTTIAVNLASEYLRRKRRVCVLDTDPQATGSATWWRGVGSERGRGHALPDVVAVDLRDAVQFASTTAGFEIVVIDCHSREAVILAALALADVVLVPCRIGVLEGAAVEHMTGLVDRALSPRVKRATRLVLTQRNDDEAAYVRGAPTGNVPWLDVDLPDREAFYSSLPDGEAVTSMNRHSDAVREIRAFTDAVERLRTASLLETNKLLRPLREPRLSAGS